MIHLPRSAADILAERLYKAGCRHAFGMPGGEVLSIIDVTPVPHNGVRPKKARRV